MREMTDTVEDVGLLDKDSMQDLFTLAVRLYIHQMYEPSARIMQFLLRHDPAKPHFHRALGKALHAQGLYEQALQSYARAAKLGMPDADVHFYIGQCLIFLKRYDLAEQALDRSILLTRPGAAGSGPFLDRAKTLKARLKAMSQRAQGTTISKTPSRETS